MSPPAAKLPYAGYRFLAEVISHAIWLYFRFPLSLRMVEEMLAARGIVVSHETVRQWALKFGQEFANRIRRRQKTLNERYLYSFLGKERGAILTTKRNRLRRATQAHAECLLGDGLVLLAAPGRRPHRNTGPY